MPKKKKILWCVWARGPDQKQTRGQELKDKTFATMSECWNSIPEVCMSEWWIWAPSLWLGGQGSLVRSGWRVMAVRACFQCRAAGWHSEEDNDVLVSHRITQHTCSHSAGVGGRPGCGGPQTAPTGTQTVPQAWPLVFPLFSGAPAQCRKEKKQSWICSRFKCSEGVDTRRQGSTCFN